VTSLDGQCSSVAMGTVFVDDPDATFESIPTYSCTKILDAQFVPVNTMAAQYIWSFQGGETSDEMSPTFSYENLDTTTHGINGLNEFTTTLTVVTNAGCTATFSVVDTIHQPNALFFPDITEGCAPLEVNFDNRSTNDFDFVEFVWDFGEGQTVTVNDTATQTYTYNTPGEYEVVLIATDELGCMDTSFVQIIQVGGPLSPDFTLSNTSICPGDSITLTDITNSDLIDAWHFATDANRSFHCYQEDVLTHTFDSEAGVFDVTLVVEYNGCYSEVTQTDAITVNGPIAHIDYLVDCADPFNISFRDSSDDATIIAWDFGDMGVSANPSVMHTYADTGDYQVVLIATNPTSGCPASFDTTTVHVRDIQAQFDLDSLLCLGIPYTLDASESLNVDADCHTGYTWYFSDPNDRPITTQLPTVEHPFEQRGTNYVTLITDDINGCRDTIIDTVRVFGVYPELIGTPTPICIPGTVMFSSLGTDADTTIENYMWDFGDGNMSEDLNPTHTYTTPPPNGTSYAVTLNVEDVIPCSGLGTFEIPVYVPTSSISASPSLNICVGETIDFSASDFTTQGSSLSWSWTFGSGASPTNSTVQNPTVTYNVAGNYQVILNYQEMGSSCVGVPDTVNVTVQDFPVASYTTNPDITGNTLCSSNQITFTDNSTSTSPVTVNWDFGGGIMTTGSEISQTFIPGSYTVTHTVTTSNQCSDSTTETFEIEGPLGDFDITSTAICYGNDITFSIKDTLNVGSWQWDFGDGVVENGTPGGPGGVVTHVYNDSLIGQTTIISLILSDGSSGCDITLTDTLEFSDLSLGINGLGITECVGDPITFSALANSTGGQVQFTWDLGDGTTQTEQSFIHTYENAGIYTVTLDGIDAMGCEDNIEETVTVEEKPEVTVQDQTVCAIETVMLDADIVDPNGVLVSWSPPQFVNDPNQASTSTNVIAAELPSGQFEFNVNVSSPNGCDVDVPLIVNAIPEFILPNLDSISVCPGQPTTLPGFSENNGYNVSWSVSGDGVSSDIANRIKNELENSPNATPFFTVPIFDGESEVELIKLTMNYSNGQANSPCDGSHEIEVNLLSSSIPNAFTPDGDGTNDFFNIDVSEFYDIRTFQIFNRWGQKVYDNDTPATGWDGMLNGNPAVSEVYIFNFETTNDECVFKGNVSLIR